jgi:MerR family transcriptional regulator, thiopeptide resistance regulator
MGRYYRVGEVATLTRVSVRTLHHYDRIGLLRPALHSTGGYRMYGEAELLRLQQILTLRYLGFPLKRIGDLLDRDDFDLVASLRVQRHALRDRIVELERVSAAIGDLVEQRLATGEWSWQLVIEASQAVAAGLTRGEEEMEAYYTPEQMAQFEAASRATPQEEIATIEQDWTVLLAEVRAARAADLDPDSAEAGVLADRWVELSRRTVQHFPDELRDAIKANYERGAFEGHDRAPQAADFAFIARVEAARGNASGNTDSDGERDALREAK